MLMAVHSALALTTNAILVSVSVTNGTPMMPRTIFKQTWTFQNTGTATWAPTFNGTTLDMIGLDSLGAVPLFPRPFVLPNPTACNDNDRSIMAGAQATYSMNFIDRKSVV